MRNRLAGARQVKTIGANYSMISLLDLPCNRLTGVAPLPAKEPMTFVSERLTNLIHEWKVDTGTESLSDHNYISFALGKQVKTPTREVPSSQVSSKGWRTDARTLHALYLDFKLRNGHAQAACQGAEEFTTSYINDATQACDTTLRRRTTQRTRRMTFWWTNEIATSSRKCTRFCRLLTRARKRKSAHEVEACRKQYCKARRELRLAIDRRIKESWEKCAQVEFEPFRLGYKIVMGKLRGTAPPVTMSLPSPQVELIVDSLFPAVTKSLTCRPIRLNEDQDYPEFTSSEVQFAIRRATMKKKAPGLDGLNSTILGTLYLANPDRLRAVYNHCLREGVFPMRWKTARLVLLRKGNKPEGLPSSYRPLCLLDDVGKVLERLLAERLEDHIARTGGLSEKQFGFRKGKSTIGALLALTRMAKSAAQKRELCAAISLDISNAFNTLPWRRVMDALEKRNVQTYLITMIQAYFSQRWVCYKTREGCQRKEVTCGVPQGSVLGPFLWNIAYDDIFQLALPLGVSLIGYADDTLIVATAKTAIEIQASANDALETVSAWISGAGLKLSVEKTEAVLLTTRKAF